MGNISTSIEKHIAKQLWLPFIEYYEIPQQKEDMVILFHLPKMTKNTLIDQAKLEDVSVTGLLNTLISDYISRKVETIKPKPDKKTGRGNVDWKRIEKTKELMRKHKEGVRLQDIAEYVGCSNARARGLMDLLSGDSEAAKAVGTDFLVYEDWETKPTRYFIAKDE